MLHYQKINKAFWKIYQKDSMWEKYLIQTYPNSVKFITKDYKRVLLQAYYIQKFKKTKKKELIVSLIGRSVSGKTPLVTRFCNGSYSKVFVIFYFVKK